LPDENFDYDEFVREEFGPPSARARRRNWFWWTVSVFVLVIMVWFLI